MTIAAAQFDLFAAAPSYRKVLRSAPKKRASTRGPVSPNWNAEAAAQRLEEGGDYRVLRRLVPRPIIGRTESRYPSLAVLVDTETTGFSHARGEVIEIGAVAFTYDAGGLPERVCAIGKRRNDESCTRNCKLCRRVAHLNGSTVVTLS